MTDRAAYSDEEWGQLVAAPVAVIAAVIGASPGGPLSIMQEVGAAVHSFERAANERRDNPLIAALLVTLKSRFEAYMGKQSDDPAVAQLDIMELGRTPERALAACRTAHALLEQKAPPAMAAELRSWLLELATAVAEAAAEGGFMGIGGEQVDAKERAMLAQLAAALGQSMPAPKGADESANDEQAA